MKRFWKKFLNGWWREVKCCLAHSRFHKMEITDRTDRRNQAILKIHCSKCGHDWEAVKLR